MTDQTPAQNPLERANTRLRRMTSRARWWTAIGVGLVLIMLTVACAFPALVMATFATDACQALPDWMGTFVFAPAALAIGSILLAALLFGLRQRFQWVIIVLVSGALLCTCAYIAWFPLIATQC